MVRRVSTKKTMEKQYFGTDGIRGRVGKFPITPDFMLRLGWAVGRVLARANHGKVLIGKDTRVSGYMLESVLEAGLIAAGVDCVLLGPMPTPAVAYLTRELDACAGIVISASHNPYYDNGIKFFSNEGKKLANDIELAIEEVLENSHETEVIIPLGKASRLDDAAEQYINFCRKTVTPSLQLSNYKIALDCANGANYHIAPKLLRELGANVVTIGTEPNGRNINTDCGSTHPVPLQAFVKQEQADFGIAFDGDGDRVIMVDHLGEVVDGDEILFILTKHLHAQQRLVGGVVGTVMTNFGFERAMQELDIDFVRTNVGDKYVMQELAARNWQLGGETSGHIICLDKTTTGDGLISALQVIQAVVDSAKSLHELKQGMNKFPQVLCNVNLQKKVNDAQLQRFSSLANDAEKDLSGGGRIVLRPSGTEPVLRVMVEGENQQQVQEIATQLANDVAAITNH